MGNGGKGTDKGRSGGVGIDYAIQGGGSDSAAFWERELGGNGSDVDSYRAFSSSSGQTNYRKYRSKCW